MATPKRRRFNEDSDDDENENDHNVFYRQASSKMLEMVDDMPTEANHFLAEEEKDEKQEHCLPYLQAVMFASVMEDGITQLRILGIIPKDLVSLLERTTLRQVARTQRHDAALLSVRRSDECNNELRIIKTMADMANLRARKYQIKQGRSKEELAGIYHQNLGCMQYKLDKLVADRIYCRDVMMGTYLDLSINRCYNSMTDSTKDVAEKEMYRICLVEEEGRNKITRRELARQMRQQRNHFKTIAYDTDFIIDELKTRVEDAALNAEIRGRYIENWQRARSEQHKQSIRDKEAGPSDTMKYYRLRMDQEQRIHLEVELLVNIFINETLTKVENWMNKYDTDIEAIDLKIQIMKNQYQNEVDKRKELEKTIEDHATLMKNWIQFKADREKARAYTEKMTKSAIVVQAWWRGLLVRLELGPYKPKKKPPAFPGPKKKK